MQRRMAIATFLLIASLAALPGLWYQFTWSKLELHAALNGHHVPWSDVFFANVTHLADGWTPVIVSFTLLFVLGWRAFLMVGLSCGLSSLVTQFLKQVVFPDNHRPRSFMDQLGEMSWVPGIDLHAHFSFPSGHSTAAFSMCLALAVIVGRAGWAAALAVLAVLLGFSRVYLSQHFTEDVLAGAAIGILTALAVYVLLYRTQWSKAAWLDRKPFAGQNQ